MGPRLGVEVGEGVGLAVTVTLPVRVSEGVGGGVGVGCAVGAEEAEVEGEGRGERVGWKGEALEVREGCAVALGSCGEALTKAVAEREGVAVAASGGEAVAAPAGEGVEAAPSSEAVGAELGVVRGETEEWGVAETHREAAGEAVPLSVLLALTLAL